MKFLPFVFCFFFFQMIIYSLVIFIILVDLYEVLAINNQLIYLENHLIYQSIKTSNDLELFYQKILQSDDLKFVNNDSRNLNRVNQIGNKNF